MRVRRLWLTDFRSYDEAELAPADGLTVVLGANGEGKTNLLEAVGYLATLSSFRGVPAEAMVRAGRENAVVRAEVDTGGRPVLIEAELARTGRGRAVVNRQSLRRARDLLGWLRTTVFSPDDLVLVKGGPAERRRYLDELLVAIHPKWGVVIGDFEKVLRQRNSLLRQAGGSLSGDVGPTLDVWDAQLTAAGEALAGARHDLLERLGPVLAKSHTQLAGGAPEVVMSYDAPWRGSGLAAALAAGRGDDLRRAVTLVGPHRDDAVISLGGMPARTHASQGEQRSVALALRLAGHALVADVVGEPPVLLLDDVFSELDADRSQALLEHLPPGQALLTTASAVPAGARPELVVRLARHRLAPA